MILLPNTERRINAPFGFLVSISFIFLALIALILFAFLHRPSALMSSCADMPFLSVWQFYVCLAVSGHFHLVYETLSFFPPFRRGRPIWAVPLRPGKRKYSARYRLQQKPSLPDRPYPASIFKQEAASLCRPNSKIFSARP